MHKLALRDHRVLQTARSSEGYRCPRWLGTGHQVTTWAHIPPGCVQLGWLCGGYEPGHRGGGWLLNVNHWEQIIPEVNYLHKVYTPSRNLRSSNMSLLKEPTSKRTWGDRSFSVAAPRLWNHLPTKVKSCHSITRFKSLLKTHLMSQFFKDDVYL